MTLGKTNSRVRLLFPLLLAVLAAGPAAWLPAAQTNPPWTAPDVAAIRRAAAIIPGQRPLRINILKFAESHRTKDVSVKGSPAEPSVQARTVFQLVYPAGTVMIDSGMDEQIHKLIGRGAVEPYFPEAAAQVVKALHAAKVIVMTHEHGDHVAGVIKTPFADEFAAKTILTRQQADTLMNHPQFPEIKLTPEQVSRYIVIDYDKVAPFAPGVALIKAPGHTPGSQMIFVTLQSGKEFLLIGDAAWHMDNIRLQAGKNAPWIVEDTDAVMAQLKWLNGLLATEKNLVIIPSHDDDLHKQLIARHVLGGNLE